MNHPKVFTEWWYFNGHLRSTENRMFTYGFCLFRVSSLYYCAHLSLTDQQENRFTFERIHYTPRKIRIDKTNRLISYNNEQVLVQTGDHDFKIKGSWQGCSIDLVLETQKPPMLFNGNGHVTMPEGRESAYYSLTRLSTKRDYQYRRKN